VTAPGKPPSLFAPLIDALTHSNLPGLPHSVVCSILWALESWSDLDARTDEDRPELAADRDRRRAYRLGLAEHALMTVHGELSRLAPPPRPPGAPCAF